MSCLYIVERVSTCSDSIPCIFISCFNSICHISISLFTRNVVRVCTSSNASVHISTHRLLKIIGLFCRIQSLLKGSFTQETYNFKEPTNRSHPISRHDIESEDSTHMKIRYECVFSHRVTRCVFSHRVSTQYVVNSYQICLNSKCRVFTSSNVSVHVLTQYLESSYRVVTQHVMSSYQTCLVSKCRVCTSSNVSVHIST